MRGSLPRRPRPPIRSTILDGPSCFSSVGHAAARRTHKPIPELRFRSRDDAGADSCGTNVPDPIKYPESRRSPVDPEFAKRDARAVEDPIAAVFDLAESVDRQTPKIRRMLRYVLVFVSLWLLLDFFLIIVTAAISPGGRPGETFLLFFPIVGLLPG